MHKKLRRPLVLAKETLRALTTLQLGEVAGGGVNGTRKSVVWGNTCSCTCDTSGGLNTPNCPQ